MAKRKPLPKKPPAAPLFDEEKIDRLIVLLVSVRSRVDVLRVATTHDKLKLSADEAQAHIAEALRRIKLVAAVDFDHELGTAKTRLDQLYEKTSRVQDFKTSLATQKELNKLLALYPDKKGSGEDAPAGDDEAVSDLHAARAHLAPLVDAGDDEPLDEIARRVVGLFAQR